MNVLDHARVVIYRVNKKGLEIFLVNSGKENWQLPHGKQLEHCKSCDLPDHDQAIELDPIAQNDGAVEKAWAIEGEWHEIPSIRGIIKQDVRIVKDHLKQKFPELEHGTYFAVKEAFKKVMPEEYALLKELKDVIRDRNQVRYI